MTDIEYEKKQEEFKKKVEAYGWDLVRDVVADGDLTHEQAVDWVFNRKLSREMRQQYRGFIAANQAKKQSQAQKKNNP